jgi:AcrR family transcriptional regulator
VDVARTVGSTAKRTRARVLDAALALFTERGYAGTSMRDLADRLEMTKAALYYHFQSKEALLRELARPLVEGLDACAATAEAGAVPVADQLRALVDLFADQRHVLHGVFYDPSARGILVEERNFFDGATRLERALASTARPPDLLRARCALGAILPAADIHALATDSQPTEDADRAWRLTESERRAITAAALAALTAH